MQFEQDAAERAVPVGAAGVDAQRASELLVAAGLVALSPCETDHLVAIERGDLRLDLLLPDDLAEAERPAADPALQWKLANVRRRLQEE